MLVICASSYSIPLRVLLLPVSRGMVYFTRRHARNTWKIICGKSRSFLLEFVQIFFFNFDTIFFSCIRWYEIHFYSYLKINYFLSSTCQIIIFSLNALFCNIGILSPSRCLTFCFIGAHTLGVKAFFRLIELVKFPNNKREREGFSRQIARCSNKPVIPVVRELVLPTCSVPRNNYENCTNRTW